MTQPPEWDASLYDGRHAFVWQHGAALLDLLNPAAGEAILDLGCGTGHLTAQLAARGARVVGIDLSQEMIATARQHYPDLSFEIADARKLAYDQEFDGVLSNAVLHWVPEAAAVAAGVARALKPGGRFVAELGGRGNVARLLAALRHAARPLGIELADTWYFPSIAEYTRVLEEAGLEVTLANLFDRPTRLDGDQGLRHWVAMFGRELLEQVPAGERALFLRMAEDAARPALWRDGAWFADYRRLRVVAVR